MLGAGKDQISRIKSCAEEEIASFLRPRGIDAYITDFDQCVQEQSCWQGQLKTKTSEFCLDSEMLLHLMAMSGITKTTETTVDAIEQVNESETLKQNKLKKTFKEWNSLSTIRAKVKHSVLRGSRNGSVSESPIHHSGCVCVSPALEYQHPLVQSALSYCSTPGSGGTVIHNEMFRSCAAKPSSTTNVLRLIEVIE